MEAKQVGLFVPSPTTERGFVTPLKGCERTGNIIYSNGNNVVVRNVKDPSDAFVFTDHNAKVSAVALSPNGSWAVSADETSRCLVWATGSSKKVKLEKSILRGIKDVVWDGDSKRICVGGINAGNRGAVFSWDMGTNLGKIDSNTDTINSVDFKPQRPYRLVTGNEAYGVNIYAGPPFKILKAGCGKHSRYVNCVRYAPDGSLFISVATTEIHVYDGKTGEMQKSIKLSAKQGGHAGTITCCSWSSDSKRLLTSSCDKTCKIWDVAEGKVLQTFTMGDTILDQQVGCLWLKDTPLSLSLSGDINYLDSNSPDKPSRVLRGITNNPTGLTVTPTAGKFYVSDGGGNLICYDIKSKSSHKLEGKVEGVIYSISSNCNETKIAAGTSKGVQFFDPKSGLEDFVSLSSSARVLAYSRKDPDLCAVVLGKPHLVIMRKNQITCQIDLPDVGSHLSWSADDTQICVGIKKKAMFFKVSGDKAEDSKEVISCENNVHLVALQSSGDHSVAIVDDQIHVYQNGELKNSSFWAYHRGHISACSWSPDGTLFLTADAFGKVIVWLDFVNYSGRKKFTFEVGRSGISYLSFIDNQTLIIVTNERITVWKLSK